jgi:hypothetical protein
MLEISFAYDFPKLSSTIEKVGQEIYKILSPYISEKNLKMYISQRELVHTIHRTFHFDSVCFLRKTDQKSLVCLFVC